MARLKELEKAAPVAEKVEAPVEVDVANNPEGGRTITLHIPDYVEITDEERAKAEEKNGPALARCDATGKLIHNEKNVNEIHNEARPEFAGLVLSTKVLAPLMAALNDSKKQ